MSVLKRLSLILGVLFLWGGYLGGANIAWAHAGHHHGHESELDHDDHDEHDHDLVPSSGPVSTVEHELAQSPHQEEAPQPWTKALWGHWHQKVIHFPIALGVFAGILLFAGLKWPQVYPVAGVALALAFVAGGVAYFSGQAMMRDFSPHSPYLPLVERHRLLGLISIGLLGLGAVAVWFKRVQRWLWIYALVLMLAVSVTGFYGGWVAHS